MERVLLILLLGALSIDHALAQQFDGVRKWSDITGKFSLDASLQELDAKFASLRKSDGRVIKIGRGRLSENDRGFLDAVDAVKQTGDQAPLLAAHMSNVATRPAATAEIIDALRTQFPQAIGAHMIGGCVYAVAGDGAADLTRSRRCAEDAIKTLENVETHFPGLHRKTLASVLNNRAVLSVRQGNLMGAATYLQQAADLLPDEIPFAVYHNASLLLNANLDLGKSRAKLAATVARGNPEAAGQVAGYLMYTLIHDPFVPAQAAVPQREDAPPPPAGGRFLTGYGSGFLIAPSLVLTNRHVAENCSAFRIKNDSGLAVEAKVEKLSTSADIDLAILKLDQPLDLTPLSLRRDVPSIGESFVVLGYPIPEVFEASLTASRGIVSKLVAEDLHVLHDASTDPGNSGGPCLDVRGNVLGVHFAGSAVSRSNRNYAISPAAIKMFLAGVADYAPLATEQQELDFAAVVAQRKDSVFMIECYSNEMPRPEPRPQQQSADAGADPMQQYALIPDYSCLACAGKGFVDCPACANGYVTIKKTVKLATTVTGETIYGPKNFKSACSQCRRGNVTCPRCQGRGTLK